MEIDGMEERGYGMKNLFRVESNLGWCNLIKKK